MWKEDKLQALNKKIMIFKSWKLGKKLSFPFYLCLLLSIFHKCFVFLLQNLYGSNPMPTWYKSWCGNFFIVSIVRSGLGSMCGVLKKACLTQSIWLTRECCTGWYKGSAIYTFIFPPSRIANRIQNSPSLWVSFTFTSFCSDSLCASVKYTSCKTVGASFVLNV